MIQMNITFIYRESGGSDNAVVDCTLYYAVYDMSGYTPTACSDSGCTLDHVTTKETIILENAGTAVQKAQLTELAIYSDSDINALWTTFIVVSVVCGIPFILIGVFMLVRFKRMKKQDENNALLASGSATPYTAGGNTAYAPIQQI